MALRDEVARIMQNGARIEEGLEVDIQSNLTNLRAAVHELQHVAVRLAEEIDKLTTGVGDSSSGPRETSEDVDFDGLD